MPRNRSLPPNLHVYSPTTRLHTSIPTHRNTYFVHQELHTSTPTRLENYSMLSSLKSPYLRISIQLRFQMALEIEITVPP